jgi:CspA family cold shock protein
MRHRGRVKFWNAEKMFGFIKPDNPSEQDIFFGRTALEGAGIEADTHVEYETEVDRRGRIRATLVKPVVDTGEIFSHGST